MEWNTRNRLISTVPYSSDALKTTSVSRSHQKFSRQSSIKRFVSNQTSVYFRFWCDATSRSSDNVTTFSYRRFCSPLRFRISHRRRPSLRVHRFRTIPALLLSDPLQRIPDVEDGSKGSFRRSIIHSTLPYVHPPARLPACLPACRDLSMSPVWFGGRLS